MRDPDAHYTPGPWKRHEDNPLRIVAVTDADQDIAGLPWPPTPSIGRVRADANGQLIAAAPDLIEAMTWLLVAVTQQEFDETYRDHPAFRNAKQVLLMALFGAEVLTDGRCTNPQLCGPRLPVPPLPATDRR